MTKVYVVFEFYGHEGCSEPVVVFKTKDLAEQFLNKIKAHNEIRPSHPSYFADAHLWNKYSNSLEKWRIDHPAGIDSDGDSYDFKECELLG